MARTALPDALQADLDRCNKCGFCMSVCPTYKAEPMEWLVTRGRVSLLQDAIAGVLDPDDPGVVESIDTCLKCRACVSVCPPQVRIDEIVFQARAARRAHYGLSLVERFVYRGLLAHPALFRGAVALGWVAEITGLRRFARATGLLRLLGLARAEEVGPSFPRLSGRQLIRLERRREQPLMAPRDDVVYFLGCAKNNLYSRAALATWRVLHRNGVRVSLPKVVCCGLPCHSAGDIEGARALARRNLSILRHTSGRIVVDESSCASHLKHLPELFAGLPEEREMHALAERVVDIAVYLDQLGIESPGHLPGVVAWHDPCHLRHHEGVIEAPRNLIRAIPGTTLVESTLEPGCCGGAGAILLTQPELSDTILERRLEGFRAAGAEAIITGGPSCVTQYRRASQGPPVFYLSEYLEKAYDAKAGQ